jgi:hypothetical protein
MRVTCIAILTVVWAACLVPFEALSAQTLNCSETHAAAEMAQAKSTEELKEWMKEAGDSYLAQSVYAFRFFELQPMDTSASSSILGLIPKDEQQDSMWHSLEISLCHGESMPDMLALSKLLMRMPHDLAMAVIIVPSKMLDYISYAELSIMYPDSDYAEQMEAVCRSKHMEFVDAVNQLPTTHKKWFVAKIFNPDGCHALTHPEAD